MHSSKPIIGLKQWVGHRAREALLLPALLRKASPKVAFFPSTPGTGAAHLRAVLVARHLRKKGWNAVSVPAQLELGQRERFLRMLNPDVLVFQQCRHPFNSFDHSFGFKYILDIDDADFHDARLQQRLEETAANACGVIAGSRYIKNWATQFNKTCNVVWTGTPISKGERPSHEDRAKEMPVVTWAQASPLNYPAELEFVRRVIKGVSDRGGNFSMRLYGTNSTEEKREIKSIFGLDRVHIETFPSMSYSDFLLSLRSVSVGLSPIVAEDPFSRGKSFGKILGYLDAKVPIVCSDHADHALFFDAESGYVSNSEEYWQSCIISLLQNYTLRNEMAERAFLKLEQRLSIERASRLVGDFIKSII